jgi:hypothetical protein
MLLFAIILLVNNLQVLLPVPVYDINIASINYIHLLMFKYEACKPGTIYRFVYVNTRLSYSTVHEFCGVGAERIPIKVKTEETSLS